MGAAAERQDVRAQKGVVSQLQCNYNIIMIRFEWDERKNKANRKKHGISFEEAQTVFFDENALEFDDPDHSGDETRFLLLGRSFQLRVLVVCHCFRAKSFLIRLISARRATAKERAVYSRRGKP